MIKRRAILSADSHVFRRGREVHLTRRPYLREQFLLHLFARIRPGSHEVVHLQTRLRMREYHISRNEASGLVAELNAGRFGGRNQVITVWGFES
jgi:hypothetical protein